MKALKNAALALLATALTITIASAEVVNRPGQTVDLNDHVRAGEITVFDFYSDRCGPCHRMGQILEELDRIDDGLVVKKVNIDRPGVSGIDWNSPVAKQYDIHSVPHLVIYRGKELIAEGESATAFLAKYIEKHGDY